MIECIEGQQVKVILTSMRAHSIYFYGLDVDQENDGAGSISGYVTQAQNGNNLGRVNGYTNLGPPFEYSFVDPNRL